jgi:superfamily II RNA helicase
MVFLCDKPYTQELEAFAQFPFPLSDFQKYAIEGVLKGHHVLVTAHTGSGKTLPAEFAIQHFVAQGKKVIYTSPIKALSNQKFYDFTQKYPHISFGLLTGDIKTNPTAQVLIMTTEILMNALFNKDHNSQVQGELSFQMDIDKELACVVFDEVHYINDAHRGQTWEQTILMLPLHIQMVMLSATIDNPQGFAEWIEQRDPQKTKEVYLASTEHRVVPLTHYGFFTTTETPYKTTKDKALHETIRAATNKPILLRSPNGQFNDAGFATIKSMTTLFDKYDWRMKRQFVLNKVAGYLKENEMLPAIVFVFSRKSVEQCAHEITTNLLEDDSKVPYIMARECEQIIRRFPNYREYLHLPEYIDLVKLLEKGIGIHHSGMMPVLREIVELMISKKYIKLLFATESFAIGLDCPIKTAVFSSLKKFDGAHMRYLLPHEYTQMAGRAGRRGIDTIGHVIHCNNLFDLPDQHEYRDVLCGNPQRLVSKFKVSYPLMFNLLKQSDITQTNAFVQKSMLQIELDKATNVNRRSTQEQQTLYDQTVEALATIQTPIPICQEYHENQQYLSMYSAKKQKEINGKTNKYKTQYPSFLQDTAIYKSHKEAQKALKKEQEELDYMENYTQYQLNQISELLTENGFLEGLVDCSIGGKVALTSDGLVAAHLHEIHPLLGADLLRYTSFMTYTPEQIVSVLSIFTDISLPEDQRAYGPPKDSDPLVIKDISLLVGRLEGYARQELARGVYSPEVQMTYDLVGVMGAWCACDSEEACKYFLQRTLVAVSLGDFTKAVLKIVVIVKELKAVAELTENLTFLTALNQVEPLVLKYVATNQSLYV